MPARHERIIAKERRQAAFPAQHDARCGYWYPSSPVPSGDDDQARQLSSVARGGRIGRHGGLLCRAARTGERLAGRQHVGGLGGGRCVSGHGRSPLPSGRWSHCRPVGSCPAGSSPVLRPAAQCTGQDGGMADGCAGCVHDSSLSMRIAVCASVRRQARCHCSSPRVAARIRGLPGRARATRGGVQRRAAGKGAGASDPPAFPSGLGHWAMPHARSRWSCRRFESCELVHGLRFRGFERLAPLSGAATAGTTRASPQETPQDAAASALRLHAIAIPAAMSGFLLAHGH